jgi:hypothetical protein
MAGDDRLSGLPDNLLRRILHFAPAKEAASTRALSRRWRSQLLRSSSALNLETHVEDYGSVFRDTWGKEREELEAVFFSRREAFVSAAEAALDAADHLTRLSLRVDFKWGWSWAERFLNRDIKCRLLKDGGVIARLLSHQGARRVEELRLGGEFWYSRPGIRDDSQKEVELKFMGLYTLSLDSLPFETLRVLHLVYCDHIVPPAATAMFPRLSCIRLRQTSVHLTALQSLIDGAPTLATVHLEAVLILLTDEATEAVLRCPAATVVMLDRCNWTKKGLNHHEEEFNMVIDIVLEIHAHRLRRFVYNGLLRPFSLSPTPPDLARVDLHFFPPHDEETGRYIRRNDAGVDDNKLVTFWGFLRNIRSAKELKLRVDNLEDIAVLSEARRVELLPTFSNLECLEMQGMHRSKGKTAAVAIANLLRCSPVLHHLRINLTTADHGEPRKSEYVDEYLVRKFESDHDKSLDLINRCSVEPATISLEGVVDNAEGDETPGLSRRSFECLQTTLRKVSLQFRPVDSNCFGIKLIRFFAENAIVLEEMHIDAGNGKLWEHKYHKIVTWITNSMKRRRSGASEFVVLPLKRGL